MEHCVGEKDEARLESSLPVVTALAFQIQDKYNTLLGLLQEAEEAKLLDIENDEEVELREASIADLEFVIREMLRLAIYLDFGDEIGRRKMFLIIRECVSCRS